MSRGNHNRLLQALTEEYWASFPSSGDAHQRACQVLVDGINHGARLFAPYPFRIVEAQGPYVTDLDGHRIIDFWQGHYANILGHNPALIRDALAAELRAGCGLHTGFPDEIQIEFAATLARAMDAERVRLTTSGTLATMYAIMLARAYTGRKVALKLAGGWHGANPLALKGVHRAPSGFDQVDSTGIPAAADEETVVTRFNDVEGLKALFEARGEQIACFIFEPCPGRAGFVPAIAEYMSAARELTARYDALLILDEVITGF
ncbi:MAG: aminotransferase class III-fold pyridoxal phosphate-dependent enzyme, partial [Chloroflexi bacterium]|nr:aminotransferase class III-fold pyridoxal phosphate-dependent enzyme [Chloroflexota bacterium]